MRFIVPRAVWGARNPKEIVRLRGSVSDLFVHHTAGAAPPDLKGNLERFKERDVMKGIQSYHMDVKLWNDIAYNFVIFPSGRIYRGRGWSRVGAHTEDHNSSSVAFCFAGNYETETPTRKAIESAQWLKRRGKRWGKLKAPVRTRGHRQVFPTACPGDNLMRVMGRIANA